MPASWPPRRRSSITKSPATGRSSLGRKSLALKTPCRFLRTHWRKRKLLMKPSLRLPRAPSTSGPKPPDGPTTPRSSGALLFSAESRKLLTYETVLAPEASLVRNALSLGDSRVSIWRWPQSSHAELPWPTISQLTFGRAPRGSAHSLRQKVEG